MKKKVCLVRMDRTGRYDVVPGTMKKVEGDTVFVQIDVEPSPGMADTIVIDVKAENVFQSEPEALIAAVQKCHQAAASWLERATVLADRLK